MDLLQSYGDKSDEEDGEESRREDGEEKGKGRGKVETDVAPALPNSDFSSSPPRILQAKSTAPWVDDTTLALVAADTSRSLHRPIDPTQHAMAFNPTYDQLWAPIHNPQGMHNHKLGFVEDAFIEPFLFDEQYNTFHKYGYATDPSGID